MATRDELNAMQKEIENYLREGLKKNLGGPLDVEVVKRKLTETLERIEHEKELPLELKKYNSVATDFLSVQFLGIPVGFDPHTMLRDLPTHFLIMLRESFGHVQGFPLNVIWLEILHRQGDLIGDWSFERLSDVEAKLNFQLKKPVDYIALNLTINGEEKKN